MVSLVRLIYVTTFKYVANLLSYMGSVMETICLVSPKEKRKKTVLELLTSKGPLRFIQLWTQVKTIKTANGKNLFTSKRDLWDVLRILEGDKEGKIERHKTSRKNVTYIAMIDVNTRNKIMQIMKSLNNEYALVMRVIEELPTKVSTADVSRNYAATVLLVLRTYLDDLNVWAHAPPNWQDFIGSLVFERGVIQFSEILVKMRKSHADATDQALIMVREKLKEDARIWMPEQ